jgi:uncharacterized protein Yka (UPF0111/DUF47 family)
MVGHDPDVRHPGGDRRAALEVAHVKRWFLPYTPDLLELLLAQCEITCRGMTAFVGWSGGDGDQGRVVRDLEHEADDARRKLMRELRAAFSTPFDAEDIYELSERLDEVLNGAKNAVRESEITDVAPAPPMEQMAQCLQDGVHHLHDALAALKDDEDRATEEADAAIKSGRALEHHYRRAMSDLLELDDVKLQAGRRELYRLYSHIGDALVRVSHRVWYTVVKES